MLFKVIVNIFVPVGAGIIYFLMASEIARFGKVRKIIFDELGYQKVSNVFFLFGIYFITRPLQNLLGPHPWPMVINNIRQFFLMAIIAPLILVGIFYWDANEEKLPKSTVSAAYIVGFLMAMIFMLVNKAAIGGSTVIAEIWNIKLYDCMWFNKTVMASTELILIHLIVQFVSPVGFLILSTAIVRTRRHNYPATSVYNMMPLKWKYFEAGLIIFIASYIVAGIAALIGHYYTYLWIIYFVGAIVSGMLELKSVKIPPRSAPADLE